MATDEHDEGGVLISDEFTDPQALDQREPVLDEGGPLAHRRLGVAPEIAQALIKELM